MTVLSPTVFVLCCKVLCFLIWLLKLRTIWLHGTASCEVFLFFIFVIVIEHNFKLLQILTNDMSVLVRRVEEVLSMNSSEHGKKKSLVGYDM